MNERIKKIIEELGLKKVDFANRLHISQPFASELCSGAKAPATARSATSAGSSAFGRNGCATAPVKCLCRTPSRSR